MLVLAHTRCGAVTSSVKMICSGDDVATGEIEFLESDAAMEEPTQA